jgi:TRAP-type mannitol/chloroaromatic compound transport system permease small subunit
MPLASRFEMWAAGLDRFTETVGRLAAWTGFALVVVMAGNVLMRYGFRTGSVALQELEWHLMAPVSLLCIAYAIKHDGHVRVDILYGRLSPRAQAWIDLASCCLALGLCAIIIWLAVPYVMQSYDNGEGSPDPGGLPYRFLLKSMIPLGFMLLAVQSLASVFRALIPLLAGRSELRPVPGAANAAE